MDLSKLTKGDRLVVVSGLLLLIDLLFLPWYSVSIGPYTATASGTGGQHGWLGSLAVLVALLMVAQILVARLTSVSLPVLPTPWSQLQRIGGIVVLVLLALKFVWYHHYYGFGAFLGIILAIFLLVGALRVSTEGTSGA